MLALGQRHAHGHTLGFRLLAARLNVGELEQLQRGQPSLRGLDATLPVRLAFLERDLAPYSSVIHRLIPTNSAGSTFAFGPGSAA